MPNLRAQVRSNQAVIQEARSPARCAREGEHSSTGITLVRLSIAAGCLSLMTAGCATVNPKPDYQRAAGIITERTGVAELYDPEAESLIEQRVAALLAHGLTKDEAVEVALLNNRAFQAAFQEIGVSRAEVVQSSLPSNPTLGLSVRFPEGGGRSNLTLALAQQLVDFWQIPVRKRIAESQLQRTILSIAREAVVLAAETEARYWRLLALERAEALAREDVELAGRSLELAQDRFNAGEAGKLDVNLARAAALAMQQRLITLRGELQAARADLTRLIGLSRGDHSWELSGELPDAVAEELDENALLEAALTQRLDAQAAIMQVHAAEAEIRSQILSIFPDVTLGTELERTENRALPGRRVLADTARASVRGGGLTAPDIQTRSERGLERSQIIDTLLGPTLDVTLPIWHQNQPQIARARYAAAQRRKQFEDLLDEIAQDVDKAVAAARSAAELVVFYRDKALPLARENVEAARRAYQAGEQSIIALMDAQKVLVAQRREYLDVRRDYAISLAELRRAIGGKAPLGASTQAATSQPAPTSEADP